MSVDLLMLGPLSPIERGLERRFTVHRLWTAPDRAAFLADFGPKIRGVVAYSGATALDAALIDALPALEIVANMGAGYESVDIAAAKARGIAVTAAGGANAVDVAEHAIGLMLDVARAISAGDLHVRSGNWKSAGRLRPTRRLSGRRLGILGLGAIGLEIARRAEAFAMPIAYHNRTPRPDLPYGYCASALELARNCDVMVIAVPGGEQTRHLVDAAVLEALGPRGMLVNIARGSVVDEPALIDALRSGRVGGAGLDVFAEEPTAAEAFLDLPNVVLNPHQAGATEEGIRAAIEIVIRNMEAHFFGGDVVNRVV